MVELNTAKILSLRAGTSGRKIGTIRFALTYAKCFCVWPDGTGRMINIPQSRFTAMGYELPQVGDRVSFSFKFVEGKLQVEDLGLEARAAEGSKLVLTETTPLMRSWLLWPQSVFALTSLFLDYCFLTSEVACQPRVAEMGR